jgi:hypothetical protein
MYPVTKIEYDVRWSVIYQEDSWSHDSNRWTKKHATCSTIEQIRTIMREAFKENAHHYDGPTNPREFTITKRIISTVNLTPEEEEELYL